ncbi:MAG TPA: GspH/FimT family pseudopilin [Candidatus Sulfopaludibacter sp.]|nr:GspH/FimT family pseudopilin [Candidatus Sulfopaludibacter sp.]
MSGAGPGREQAFTLLEIMMVVAIIGLMMTMSVPAILRTMHQEPLRKAVNDVLNICSHARAQAILRGVTTTVVFHPQSGDISLADIATTNSPDGSGPPDAPTGETTTTASPASALNSAHFDDSIIIDMLDVNLSEYKDASEVPVRFFPDGTSDEMTLIIHSGDQYQKITLEVTTGLASTEPIR